MPRKSTALYCTIQVADKVRVPGCQHQLICFVVNPRLMIWQVQEVSAKASQERMLEADVMLASLAEQRQLAAAAADEKVLLRKQQLHNARCVFIHQY